MKSKRRVLAVVSDLHCGSTIGLHPEAPTELDDGGRYEPSKAQLWIWQHWERYWDAVRSAAKGADLHLIQNGDAVDGDHHGTAQIVSRHPSTQYDILKACWTPVLSRVKAKSFAVVRGTEVHVGKSGSVEESFARWVAAKGIEVPREAGTGNHSHWHLKAEYGGVTVDATHHGRMGTRPWTKMSGVATLAAQIVFDHALTGEKPPMLALRSHYHQHQDTFDAFPTRLIQTGAWQLATSYIYRIAPGSLADIGGIIVVMEGGQIVDVQKMLIKPDRPTTWSAP